MRIFCPFCGSDNTVPFTGNKEKKDLFYGEHNIFKCLDCGGHFE